MAEFNNQHTAIESIVNKILVSKSACCREIDIRMTRKYKTADEAYEVGGKTLSSECIVWIDMGKEKPLALTWEAPVSREDGSGFDMLRNGAMYHILCASISETFEFEIDKNSLSYIPDLEPGAYKCKMATQDNDGKISDWSAGISYTAR